MKWSTPSQCVNQFIRPQKTESINIQKALSGYFNGHVFHKIPQELHFHKHTKHNARVSSKTSKVIKTFQNKTCLSFVTLF